MQGDGDLTVKFEISKFLPFWLVEEWLSCTSIQQIVLQIVLPMPLILFQKKQFQCKVLSYYDVEEQKDKICPIQITRG